MKQSLLVLLFAFLSLEVMAQDSTPKKCKHFEMTVSVMQLGSQTIIFGCESDNTPYKGLEISLNKKNDQGQVIGTATVGIDSRQDEAVRSKVEDSIVKISDGTQSNEQARAMRQLVYKELRLALDSATEEERNDHLNTSTENLKKTLTE